MKTWTKGLLALGLALGLGRAAWADDQGLRDSLTVTITPNAYYSVSITTAGPELNLGTLDMSVSTYTVKPATVTIHSSFASTDLTLQGSIAGGMGLETANANAPTSNNIGAWAVFTDTGNSTAATVVFTGTLPGATGSDVFDTTGITVDNANGDGTDENRFVETTGNPGNKVMDNLPNETMDAAASKAHLWLKFTMPAGVTSTGAQNITLTLVAGAF